MCSVEQNGLPSQFERTNSRSGYAGSEGLDASTGLHYNFARYMDPELGRLIVS